MGNHALRRQTSMALRAAGLPHKLYRGKSRVAWKYLHAKTLRNMIKEADRRVGDLINDCDGFNHRITKVNVSYGWNGVLMFNAYNLEDKHQSCGCSGRSDDSKTVEQIVAFFNVTDQQVVEMGDWWTENDQRLLDKIKAGEPICDKDGIKLPL